MLIVNKMVTILYFIYITNIRVYPERNFQDTFHISTMQF